MGVGEYFLLIVFPLAAIVGLLLPVPKPAQDAAKLAADLVKMIMRKM